MVGEKNLQQTPKANSRTTKFTKHAKLRKQSFYGFRIILNFVNLVDLPFESLRALSNVEGVVKEVL